jgi:hypothetical protein
LEPAEKSYIAYPRTCGLAWSCHGAMVFFANEKYNLKVLEKQPELKKVHEWPNPNSALLSGIDIIDGELADFTRIDQGSPRKKKDQALFAMTRNI